jgi:XTP/dITP diphosphohydrolase
MTMIVATRNRHKADEISAILGVHCLTLRDFPEAPELAEEADSFAGNAAQKAIQLARWLSGRPPAVPAAPEEADSPRRFVLADDSGLEVDFLHGAPGVYSARFAAIDSGGAGNSTDAQNNAKLLHLLRDVPLEKRTARFRCALALINLTPPCSDPQARLFEGVCEGQIRAAASGTGGFGYDPLFVPNGFRESFAELGEEVKNRISHRAQALARLREWLSAPSSRT